MFIYFCRSELDPAIFHHPSTSFPHSVISKLCLRRSENLVTENIIDQVALKRAATGGQLDNSSAGGTRKSARRAGRECSSRNEHQPTDQQSAAQEVSLFLVACIVVITVTAS